MLKLLKFKNNLLRVCFAVRGCSIRVYTNIFRAETLKLVSMRSVGSRLLVLVNAKRLGSGPWTHSSFYERRALTPERNKRQAEFRR